MSWNKRNNRNNMHGATIKKNNLLLVECYFCHGHPGYNFTCTSCTIWYHATQTAEIFHILQLLLNWGWLL